MPAAARIGLSLNYYIRTRLDWRENMPQQEGGSMAPALPQLSYTEVKFIIDALTEKADRYEGLASRTVDPIEKAMIQNHAQRYRALMHRFTQLPTMPPDPQEEKLPKPAI
jgi:hypothetical protein